MQQRLANVPRLMTGQPHEQRMAIDQLFARITDASRLAAGAAELVQLASRSTDSLEELEDLIRTDPSLVALIVRRVNSPYYGLDAEVTTLSDAAQLLGFREVRNLAITVYVSRMFDAPMETRSFSVRGLWNHSVAVAVASHLVARVCGCAAPADAYIAGLLHDVGLLLLNRKMRRHFMQLVERVEDGSATCDIERDLYFFDHARLGAHVAAKWEFPTAVCDAIRFHHSVRQYSGVHQELVYTVAAANFLCSRAGWTSLGVHNVEAPPDRTYKLLGVDQIALSVIWKELVPSLEKSTYLAE